MALNNPYALSFDGVDDRIDIPHADNVGFNYPFEIEFYINTTYSQDKSITLVNKVVAATGLYGYHIYLRGADGRIGVDVYSSKFVAGGSAAAVVNDGEAHCVSVYFTSSQYAIYVDGAQGASRVVTLPKPGAHQIVIGALKRTSAVGNYAGAIDELRIWGRTRTQAEREAMLTKKLTGDENGLTALYRLDTGSGDVAIDSSPNENHGEIHGASWVPGLVDLHLPGEVLASARFQISFSMPPPQAQRVKGASARFQIGSQTHARAEKTAISRAKLQIASKARANGLVLFVPKGVFIIDSDEIFAKNQPSRGGVVANRIEVWVNPLKPAETAEEVYRSKDPVTIYPDHTEMIEIFFDDEPVTEPAVTLAEAGANLSIVGTRYYAWGAVVSIQNTGTTNQSCLIVATGKPLKVQGREKVVKEDPVSIQEIGPKVYEFDNPFVQDRATAEIIADKLLSFANAKRDIEIEWRGNPALELADVTMIPEYQRRGLDQRGIFYITKQELEFDGGLKAKLEGRKM